MIIAPGRSAASILSARSRSDLATYRYRRPRSRKRTRIPRMRSTVALYKPSRRFVNDGGDIAPISEILEYERESPRRMLLSFNKQTPAQAICLAKNLTLLRRGRGCSFSALTCTRNGNPRAGSENENARRRSNSLLKISSLSYSAHDSLY